MIYRFQGYTPVVHPSAFVHPQACVTGNVIIGPRVYIGPGAALRGDWGEIEIEEGCNIQENCTLHMFPGTKVWLKAGAHIGHGAVIHGATLGENCLIGMNAVVMDDAVVGAGSIVGALAFVPAGMEVPPRSVLVGNPAKIIKQVSDEMLEWKTAGTKLYQQLPSEMHGYWEPCEPLTEIPQNRPTQQQQYATWKETQNKKN